LKTQQVDKDRKKRHRRYLPEEEGNAIGEKKGAYRAQKKQKGEEEINIYLTFELSPRKQHCTS